MSNIAMRYCPVCDRTTEQYNVDWGMWECEECGEEICEDEPCGSGSENDWEDS